MPTAQEVLAVFSLFSDLSIEECARYQRFCERGINYLQRRLREDVDLSSVGNKELFCEAAAARAYCDYLMLQGGGNASDELRIGDISLKNASSDGRQALEIRDYFMEAAATLFQPDFAALIQVEL